ncbi:MAG: endonuclease III [Deltaproteobacteria bacterium]|jgi:endonuclease-3|nr:endonuclease III [Deltaproteobacteria bacterium]
MGEADKKRKAAARGAADQATSGRAAGRRKTEAVPAAPKTSPKTSSKTSSKTLAKAFAKKSSKPTPDEIMAYLDEKYPDPRCGLEFQDPYQLLVATILSAQCTDKRVNMITPDLFRAYPGPRELAGAEVADIEGLIKTCGLYRAKAKNLSAAAKRLVADHGGEVPGVLEELVALPGVGRKTANVVLGDAFGVPGLTVDTHLGRVGRRLGLTESLDPVRVEADLAEVIPQKLWTRFSHQMISHGRATCAARGPRCADCGLVKCPSRLVKS